MIAVREGKTKLGKSILGNEVADVLAKKAAEGVPPDDYDKWMSWGGGGVSGSGRSGGREKMWRKKGV